MNHLIAPSVLSADFRYLARDLEMINNSKADWFHVDVMDGRFVPNISFGMFIIDFIKRVATKPLDVHLMMVEPEKYIEEFRKAGADIITVHFEACPHLHRTIQQIKQSGAKAGVALNPHTPVEMLTDIIKDLDLVLIMSVNPGFGGQSFIPNTINKIKRCKSMIIEKGSSALIEVDGGVGPNNIAEIVKAGADVLVAGNAVFKTEDPTATILELKNLEHKTLTV
ncbi:MAG TPA: ribulose-phosphate 3-epimerase [Saprospiraceae bacterium]|nr:ribulose-phosphate 3-epimerase [Saprospiraceae bacterium]